MALVRALGEAVNAHDVARLSHFYSEDAVVLSPVYGEISGRNAIAQSWQSLFALFPDWQTELTDVLLDHDRLALMGTATATDRNGWFGQRPTGERISYRALIVLTIRKGKIIRDERIYDLSAVLPGIEKAHVESELRLAAEVQRALWSGTERPNGFCEAAGKSIPCRWIGGDFFEMRTLPSGNCAITLGDIAGKGPAAAILAAVIQGMLAAEAENEYRPSAVLLRMNRRLVSRGIEPRFATLVYGLLSPDGRFSYSNGGHNPPILLTRDGVRRLATGGPIVGALAESIFEEETISLRGGETIIMFSDGVTDAHNPRDEEFGEDRFMTFLANHASQPVPELLNGILGSVSDFCEGAPQIDDISVTVARYENAARQ